MNAKRKKKNKKTGLYPFRAAVVRGLGVVAPPLLTVLIFIWVGTTVQTWVLEPGKGVVRYAIVRIISAERPVLSSQDLPAGYKDLGDGTAVPVDVYADVSGEFAHSPKPPTADEIYGRYVEKHYFMLNKILVIPCFLSLFILALYLSGKFIAASMGRFFWGQFERGVGQVPLVSTVYSAVKQVSDLFLQERELEYSRIVAVEWPRKGIWSVALVTGEGMVDIEAAANEPVLSVLIPNSPAPITGFTLTVKKSETIDLNISLDQAIQFIVSCGVVVPPGQVRDIEGRRVVAGQLPAPDDSSQSESDEQP